VIVAAGPWSTSLLDPIGIRLAITGARGWIVRVRPASGTLRHMVEHAGWRVAPERLADVARPSAGSVAEAGMPEAVVGAVLHLHADGTVLVGSSRQPWLTPEPEEPSVPQQMLRAGIRLAPSLADATVTSTWWGLRPMNAGRASVRGNGARRARGRDRPRIGGRDPGRRHRTARNLDRHGWSPAFDAAPFDPFRFAG
jgi:glycine/D-amino acid oxidase-like deaminating enzyme